MPINVHANYGESDRRRGLTLVCVFGLAEARAWGFEEMLIKVEAGNRPAESLYHRLGYEVSAEDKLAERPEPGTHRVRWVRTSNVVLRKDLTKRAAKAPSPPVGGAVSVNVRGG